MRIILLLIISQIIDINGFGQETILSDNLVFNDGVYLSHEDFRTNSPSLKLSEVRFDKLKGNIPSLLYLHRIGPAPYSESDFEIDSVWGVCIDGVPFIRSVGGSGYSSLTALNGELIKTEDVIVFSKLMMIGHICHFSTEIQSSGIDVNYGNTYNSNNDIWVIVQGMVKVSTGEVCRFKGSEMLRLIRDDVELYKRYKRMLPTQRKKLIFEFYRQYNSRNPIVIDANTTANKM